MGKMNLIAATILEYRERCDLSYAALSEQIGIGSATLFQIEHGNDLPTFPNLQAIARFFKLDPTALGEFILAVPVTPRRDSKLRRRKLARAA